MNATSSGRDAGVAVRVAVCALLTTATFVSPSRAQQSANEPVIYLNQAWSQDDRDWYDHFSQGSAVLSYDIFLNLEVAGDQELFRSDANSARYGLLPAPASKYNPDGLPIGISKTTVATPVGVWPAGEYAGLTCAACHEDELHYKGKRIRIEGGINHTFDIQAYNRALDDALQSTLTDAAKFDRLAGRAEVFWWSPTSEMGHQTSGRSQLEQMTSASRPIAEAPSTTPAEKLGG